MGPGMKRAMFRGNAVVMYETASGERRWKMRAIGAALGYTSNGGNFSHLTETTWATFLVAGVDYERLHADPGAKSGAEGTIWLTDAGLLRALSLAATLHEKATEVTKLRHWISVTPAFQTDAQRRARAGANESRKLGPAKVHPKPGHGKKRAG